MFAAQVDLGALVMCHVVWHVLSNFSSKHASVTEIEVT